MVTVKVFKQGASLGVTIPLRYRAFLKWVKGDQIAVELDGDALILREIKAHARRDQQAIDRTARTAGNATGAQS